MSHCWRTVPRSFTVFEAPSERPSLELVVMFDVSSIGGGFWDLKNLREFSSRWNEAMTQASLDAEGPRSGSRFVVSISASCGGCAAPLAIPEIDALRRVQDPAQAVQAYRPRDPPDAGVPTPEAPQAVVFCGHRGATGGGSSKLQIRFPPTRCAIFFSGSRPMHWRASGRITRLDSCSRHPAPRGSANLK